MEPEPEEPEAIEAVPAEPEPEPEPEPPKPVQTCRITLKMLEEAVFPDNVEANVEERAERLFQVSKLRLKGRGIAAIENLEMFTALRYLFLGHNQIERIENMEFHPNLIFLTVNHNRLSSLAGIEAAPNLKHLNAAANQLVSLTEVIGMLPAGLEDLLLAGNPAALEEDYRQQLVGALPQLAELDEVEVTNAELAAFGFEVDEEQPEGVPEEQGTAADRAEADLLSAPAEAPAGDGGGGGGGGGGNGALEIISEGGGAAPQPGPGGVVFSSHGVNFEATATAMAEEVIAPFRAARQAMTERSKQRQAALLAELPQ